MYPFVYHRPKTLQDARRIFEAGENATLLSGGHTLLPAMKLRLAMASDVVDLGGIAEMRGIERDGTTLTIGAAVTHAEVAAAPVVREMIPALAGCAGSIGDRHVRHRGAIGGSIANNDPAADYPAAALALAAVIVTDRRRIPADDFFAGFYQTALQPGEIVTKVVFSVPMQAGYAKFRSPASRFSIVGVFVARNQQGVRVAVTGAGANGVFRASAFEDALAREFSVRALEKCRVDPSMLMRDQNGTPEYRAELIRVMARRAVENPDQALSFK
jgi:aerobic carbon-monoxide dehydrogenase medium subunit